MLAKDKLGKKDDDWWELRLISLIYPALHWPGVAWSAERAVRDLSWVTVCRPVSQSQSLAATKYFLAHSEIFSYSEIFSLARREGEVLWCVLELLKISVLRSTSLVLSLTIYHSIPYYHLPFYHLRWAKVDMWCEIIHLMICTDA